MRPPRLRSLAALLGALGSLALVAPAAGAAVSHPYLGIVAGDAGEELRNACGVAVDGEGNRYHSNYYRQRIEIFNYEAPPLFQVGAGRLTAGGRKGSILDLGASSAACELAVDSAGRLYANDWHQSVVRFLPSAYPFPVEDVPTYSAPVAIDADDATGVAVDRATDRVYVAHRTYVAVYEPGGTGPVLVGGEPLLIGAGTLGDANGLAVSDFAATAGRLYVADAADDTVKAYDPGGDPVNPVQTIDGAATPQGGFVDLSDSDLAVDDGDGHLFVVDGLGGAVEHPIAVVDEFGPDGAYLGQLPKAIVHGRSAGVAVDNSSDLSRGLVYVSSGDEAGAALLGFCPATPIEPRLVTLCPAAPPTKLLRVARTGAGFGAVASQPAWIACGVLCVGEFRAGSTVTLTATPAPHSAFAGWSVAGAPAACLGTGACQVTLAADTEVSASFVPLPPEGDPGAPPEPAPPTAPPPNPFLEPVELAAVDPAGAAARPRPRRHHRKRHQHRQHRRHGKARR